MRIDSLFLVSCAAHGAFAAVGRSSFSNSTVFPSSTLPTLAITSAPLTSSVSSSPNSTSSCVPHCWIAYPAVEEYQWAPASTSAVVVATVVYSVNNATNVTSTSTIYNTEFEDPLPGITNPAGTQVSTLTVSDPVAGTNWSTVVAYPTPFVSYAYSWEVEGTYETTSANGATACITGSNQTYTPILLPSHPPVPFSCEANTSDPDPNGEFYRLTTVGVPDGNWTCNSPDFKPGMGDGNWASVLFPNVMPTGCASAGVAPAMVLTVVKSLTDTVTNYFSSANPASQPAATTLLSSSSVAAAATPQSTTSSPQPTPEKAPPTSSSGVSSKEAVLSKDEGTTTSTTPVAQVTSSSAIMDDKSSTSTEIASLTTSNVQVTTPTSSVLPLISSAGAAAPSVSFSSPVANGANSVVPSSAIVVSNVVISSADGGTSVLPSSAISASNTVISSAPGASAISIGSSTIPPSISSSAISEAQPAFTFNSQPIVAGSSSDYVFGSQILRPGSAITVSDNVISLASNAAAVIIGSSTIPLAAPVSATSEARPVVTFGSQPVTANSASVYVLGSQTLVPGSAITVSDKVISLATNAAAVIIGSSTIPLAIPAATAASKALPVIPFGSQSITANSASDYIFGSQTLVPGSAITISNTIISLATNAAAIAIGSSIIPLTAPPPAPSVALPVITIASQPLTANSASDYIFGTQTLVPGSAITVSNTAISLATGASALFIGSSTTPPAAPAPTISRALPVLAISGSTITANAASEFVFNTQTLTPGGAAITVSGNRLSLATDAGFVVEGTATIDVAATGTGAAMTGAGTGVSVGEKGTGTGTGGGVAGATASDKSTAGQIIQPFTGSADGRGRGGGLGRVGGIGRAAWIVGVGVGAWGVWGS